MSGEDKIETIEECVAQLKLCEFEDKFGHSIEINVGFQRLVELANQTVQIKEVHELKEGSKYIITAEEMSEQDRNSLGTILENVGIPTIITDKPIKIYEVKKE